MIDMKDLKKNNYIYFASSNKNKLEEIKSILQSYKSKRLNKLKIKSAPEGFYVKEDGKTFLENAFKKASFLSKKLNKVVFAEDSGMEVFALGGKPGIKSARFFKGGKGMLEIIKKLSNKKNRKCCFTAAIVVTNEKGKTIFKTQRSCHGTITHKPIGNNGFGYDPIFLIPTLNKTSAQISQKLKNKLSHRALVTKDFAKWLIKTNYKLFP